MKRKFFYIISISASLAILVFFNGETIVFAEINKDGEGLIIREGKDYDLDSSGRFLFGNNIEKFVDIINSIYFVPTIIVFLIIIIGIDTFLREFFKNTITIRGPPVSSI